MPATAALPAAPPDAVETAADLLRRLGDVPASRVRLKPHPGTATEQDVIAALEGPVKRLYELIDGVLVEKAVGSAETFLGFALGSLIWSHVRARKLGVVLGGDGPVRLRPGNVRYPDVSFIPWSSFPGGVPPKGEKIWSVTPALAVEVLSEGNTAAEIDLKLQELFSTGCKLAWVIDPEPQSAKVYASAKRFKSLDITGTLDGGKVLPGFVLPLADLFAETEPPA